MASDSVSFDGESKDGIRSSAFSVLLFDSVGEAGGVSITAKSLSVTGGAKLDATTYGQGNAGSVTIVASDTVSFDGESKDGFRSGASSAVAQNVVGDAGGVSITAKSLTLTNGAQLEALSLFGQGNAGSVTIVASDSVSFDGESKDGFPSGAFSQVYATGEAGYAGGMSITTKSLTLTNGAQINASTSGKGNAGSVKIVASDSVSFDGRGRGQKDGNPSGILNQVGFNAVGETGNIDIHTKLLTIANGAVVQSITLGNSKAGSITIMASDTQTGRVILQNGGQIIAGTGGDGEAGTLTIKAKDSVEISGSVLGAGSGFTVAQYKNDPITQKLVFAGFEPLGGFGTAGKIDIETGQLTIRDGAQVTVSSKSSGKAGSLTLIADSIRLNNKVILSADTKGGGGDITLTTQSLIMQGNSSITTKAEGENIPGGTITLNLNNGILLAKENSDISADSKDFRGGNVTINARAVFGTSFREQANDTTSDITATGANSQSGGTVQINTPDSNGSLGLVQLSENPIDASRLIAQSCIARRRETGTFYITGTGGLPTRPGDALVSPYSTGTVRSLSSANAINNNSNELPASESQSNDSIVEAQGVYKLETGQVVLGRPCPD